MACDMPFIPLCPLSPLSFNMHMLCYCLLVNRVYGGVLLNWSLKGMMWVVM